MLCCLQAEIRLLWLQTLHIFKCYLIHLHCLFGFRCMDVPLYWVNTVRQMNALSQLENSVIKDDEQLIDVLIITRHYLYHHLN